MRPIRIIPEYAILLHYDVLPDSQETYFRYVVGEFVPAMQDMKLYMQEAWEIAWGPQPQRQVEFITDKYDNIRNLLQSDRWERLEGRLKSYTYNYVRRIVRYKGVFKI